MTVTEINEGTKIPYEVDETKICFNDDLTINLAKRQQDDEVRIDVCSDKDGNLVIGAATGSYFVAQILLPGITYLETETAVENDSEATEGTSTTTTREAQDLDMDDVEIILWALENYVA